MGKTNKKSINNNINSNMKYFKILFILTIISNYACNKPNQLKNTESFTQITESVINDTNKTHRSIKINFCTNTLAGDAPLKLYSNQIFKISNTEFSIDTKDTITLNLPIQNHDTVFTKNKEDKNYKIDRLLKFKHGVIYKWCVNSCSGVYYFAPTNIKSDTTQAMVSFTIKNYNGKNKIVGQRGYNYDEDVILLRNNIKSEYYKFLSISAMCSSDPKRIAIENMDKKVVEKLPNGEEYKSNLTHFEIWFDDIHGEKLDITYDFKSKKSTLLIVE